MKAPLRTAKMTDEEVWEMRVRYAKRETTPKYEAARFGVAIETIRKALRGDTFRNVRFPGDPEPPPLQTVSVADEEEMAARAAASARKVMEMMNGQKETGGSSLDYFFESVKEQQKSVSGPPVGEFETPEPDEEGEQAESALDRFMRETKAAKAASPDALLEELKTAAPTDSGEQAGETRE